MAQVAKHYWYRTDTPSLTDGFAATVVDEREAGVAAYETADNSVNRYACANDSDSRRLLKGQEEVLPRCDRCEGRHRRLLKTARKSRLQPKRSMRDEFQCQTALGLVAAAIHPSIIFRPMSVR